MTNAEKIITNHVGNKNGLTNPTIAHMETGYALSTCKRVFKIVAYENNGMYFLTQGGTDALEIEKYK